VTEYRAIARFVSRVVWPGKASVRAGGGVARLDGARIALDVLRNPAVVQVIERQSSPPDQGLTEHLDVASSGGMVDAQAGGGAAFCGELLTRV
jgi:hypothetical protein